MTRKEQGQLYTDVGWRSGTQSIIGGSTCIRVGHNHTYGVYPVFLTGKSPDIRSNTVHIYGSGQPYTCTRHLLGRASRLWLKHMRKCAHVCMHTRSHTRTHTNTHTCTHTHTYTLMIGAPGRTLKHLPPHTFLGAGPGLPCSISALRFFPPAGCSSALLLAYRKQNASQHQQSIARAHTHTHTHTHTCAHAHTAKILQHNRPPAK